MSLTQVSEEEATQLKLSPLSRRFFFFFFRIAWCVCVCVRVNAFVHLQSASSVASVLSVSAPAAGSSHPSRPLPLPVCQYKAWSSLSHTLTHRRNTAGAELNVFRLILSRSTTTTAGKNLKKVLLNVCP